MRMRFVQLYLVIFNEVFIGDRIEALGFIVNLC